MTRPARGSEAWWDIPCQNEYGFHAFRREIDGVSRCSFCGLVLPPSALDSPYVITTPEALAWAWGFLCPVCGRKVAQWYVTTGERACSSGHFWGRGLPVPAL